ncbi:MFS transporter [Microbacterium terricola]|uniref:MFS transporter n=1 Tax=Microbacterium terricola TaxID=344163 RepID=A0ABM8E1T7_9MICO|nr:MFS transporter [Microbacterium terricola]
MEPDAPARTREPRGFAVTYWLASYGLYLGILTPILGGLAVRVQNMVGLEAAPAVLGLVMGVGSLFALVAQPLAGRLSDRTTSKFGMRRPWILAGVLVAGVSLALVGVVPAVWMLLVVWCLAQIASNFAQGPETAAVADQVPHLRRGFISGLAGTATPIAILTGAVILNAAPSDALRSLVPALLATAFGLLFVFTLKDRVRTQPPAERFSWKEFFGTFYFNPRTHRDLGWAWLTKALIMFAFGALGGFLTLFTGAQFGLDVPAQLAFNLSATMVQVAAMVIVSVIAGKWSDKINRRKPFVTLGGVLVGLGVIVVALSPLAGDAGLTVILVAEAILGIGAGLFFGVDQAMCIDVLPDEDSMAKDLGVLNIANTLPAMVAPFLAGTIFIPIGTALFGGGYSVWFAFAGVVGIIGGLLVTKIRGVK